MPDRRTLVVSIAAAIAAALASYWSVAFATPIDRALPFFAVVIVALSLSRPWIAMAVPLLIVAENVLFDEPTRLLTIALILAVSFAFCGERTSRPLMAFLAILILRWIPLHNVIIWRELIILIGAIAVAYVMNGVNFAVLLALFAPAWPIKLAIVLFALAIGAAFWLRRMRFKAPAFALLIALFPWSGLMARGWKAFIHPPRQGHRQELRYALKPGSTMTIDVPEHAEALIISGANTQKLPCSTVLGWMNGAPLVAPDWGFMRREQFFASHNCYPRDPAGKLRDYGWSAWIDGAARVPLPYGARSIRVAVNPQLPKNALLQVEAFE